MASHIKKTRRWVALLSIVFISLLVAIGTLIYSDNKQVTTTQATLETINSIRIQRPGFAEIQLILADDLWLFEEPCDLTVNKQRLEPLLGALLPTNHSYAAQDVDLNAAGLSEPLATVFLNDTRIHIGDLDLNGNRRYIQRNNQVEFAPEWILSLINGGLSALANLEIFSAQINAIKILDDSNASYEVPPESIADWQALSAQQIVSWPLQPKELALITQSLSIQQGDESSLLKVYTYSRFSALHYENEECAFILGTESLPDTTSF
jgi:hypothetical protein